jgi:hypothetical protein
MFRCDCGQATDAQHHQTQCVFHRSPFKDWSGSNNHRGNETASLGFVWEEYEASETQWPGWVAGS